MQTTKEKIEFALNNGLFEKSQYKTDSIDVFDSYGNYVFPTDFSNKGDNTILSLYTTTLNLEVES